MLIFRISRKTQPAKLYRAYYDGAIVICDNEEEARICHPYYQWDEKLRIDSDEWVLPSEVIVELIGVAAENQVKGVVINSYNAW
jgi:hypothetical protein